MLATTPNNPSKRKQICKMSKAELIEETNFQRNTRNKAELTTQGVKEIAETGLWKRQLKLRRDWQSRNSTRGGNVPSWLVFQKTSMGRYSSRCNR